METELPESLKEMSYTKINMYLRCPLQFQYRYVEGIKIPPPSGLAFGISGHTALEHNYHEKVKTKADVPVDTMTDVFVDTWRTYRGEMALKKDENFDTIENEGIAVLRGYHKEVAPGIVPRLVEEMFTIPLTDALSLTGKIDIVDLHEAIHDHKFTKKSPAANVLDKDLQVSAYILAYRTLMNKEESGCFFNYAVRTKTPKFTHREATRTDRQLERFKNIAKAVARQIEVSYKNGVFYPNPTGWTCTFDNCGWWRLCHSRF